MWGYGWSPDMMCLGLGSAAEIKAEAGVGGLIAEALPFPPARSPCGRDAQTAAYYQILSSSPGKGQGHPRNQGVWGRPICELALQQQVLDRFCAAWEPSLVKPVILMERML